MKKELFGTEFLVMRDTFRRLLRRHARTNLINLLEKTHPADMAQVYRYFNETEQKALFELMPENEATADFLLEVDDTIASELLAEEEQGRISKILKTLSAADQVEILNYLPEEKRQYIIDHLADTTQREVEEILAYPEDSAGSLMYTDVFTLHEETFAKDAIAAIQDQANVSMVFYLYVTDDAGKLNGVISLRDLVTTPGNTQLKDVMGRRVQSVRPEMDQEEVARIVSRYNYLAVPVTSEEGKLLGIVTVDDVLDVIREEATEDFLKMAGVGKDREILLKSTWDNAKSRIPWLFASWIGGVMAAVIIGIFDHMLQSVLALAAFIPVIIGMGGNIGTQSSTLIVRGIATGRVDIGNNLKVIFKEVRVGLVLGSFYGILLGLFAYFRFLDASPYLGVVVGLSIFSSMLIAATIGTFVPLVLRRMDIDPAIATGPFVTTSIDILGVSIYFLIATLFLTF